jgi:hypothetical protein
MEFAPRDDPCAVLDQYLGEEDLEELIMEKGSIFNNDLPRTSHIDAFNDFQIKILNNIEILKNVIYNAASDL